jgi:amidase
MHTSIPFLPLREVSRRIHAGEISSVDYTRSLIEHINRHNPRINAICIMDDQNALREASKADAARERGEDWGALHGIPFTVKDTFATKGMRTSFANPLTRNHIPDYDATLVERVKNAGGILLGKTNLPMFAFDWQSTFWGRTNNPYNELHVVGGSSGGSAAALAAGFTPMEIGSDIGGSLRIPAHYCGVVGFRPTERSLSDFGHIATPNSPKMLRSMITVGPMARSVDDVKMLLQEMWGYDERMWQNPPVPLQSSLKAEDVPLSSLRIAYSPTIGERNVSRDTERVFSELLAKLQSLGCKLEEKAPAELHTRRGTDRVLQVWGELMTLETLPELPPFVPNWIVKPLIAAVHFASFRGGSAALVRGLMNSERDFAKTLDARDEIVRESDSFFNAYDVWLTPSAAHAAFPHVRTGTPLTIDGVQIPYTEAHAPFACTTVLQATPIVTLPMGMSSDGLPISISVHGKRWHDWRLLTIAEQIEGLGMGFVPPQNLLH